MSAGWTEGDIDADGVRLHFHRAGTPSKPALLLAHGLSDSGRCWFRVAEALGEHFDIVMPDARNHGDSGTAPTSPDVLVDDLESVVAALGLEHPILMGHSVGAHTVASLGVRRPALAPLLVLEDPPWPAARELVADESAAKRRSEIVGWLGSFAGQDESEIAEAGRVQHGSWHDDDFPGWAASNLQVRVEAADGLDFGAWGATAAGIACPTLLVHGEAERGGIVTPEVATRVVELNPHVASALVADAGHNVRRENFERYIEVVTSFLLSDRTAL